ncbi:MAG: hypothetical protein Q4E33_03195 [Erysipelotrichaceae bacterium]|nr:hypothetical protein [Erysipelotrichaceae bacterium]
MQKIKSIIESYGLPRTIITCFIILMFCLAPVAQINMGALMSNVLNRFVMNAILVLAMVPMVHSGCGLNFGLPLGIEAGLLGATLSVEFGFTGVTSFVMAIVFAIPIATVFGLIYGLLLNKIKGGEMMIATYVGFSIVSLMCIMWLILPYHSPNMVWGYSGNGLRTTITLEGYYSRILSDLFKIEIGKLVIPTGAILFFALLALIIWAFLHTKTGTAMTAVGSNPTFAKAAGINIDKIRTLSVVMSTILGAIGIIVYEQAFGYIQLYTAPISMAMPAVAAILLGGASVNKATIFNVVIGTILYQGIVTVTPAVMNALIALDISDVIRNIVSNGVILYALTRKIEEGKKRR